jgi:voltage-gated sodium channel
MTDFCKKVADSKGFQNFVTVAILLAGLLVGMATYADFYQRNASLLDFLNNVVLGIFIIEIAVKMLAEGTKPWNYFKDAWNIFDFIIVAAAFLPFGGSSIAILRLLRLLRVLKLIKALPKLQVLVNALLKSIPSMGYVSILLFLLFYIYSVAAVFFFGANDPVHFSDLQNSFLSMFRVVTLEDWTDVMYINMYGCENYGYSGNEALCTNSSSSPLFGALFFVSFVLLGTMIFLNLFIGVIMNGMDEARTEQADDNRDSARCDKIDVAQIEEKVEELQNLLSDFKRQNK